MIDGRGEQDRDSSKQEPGVGSVAEEAAKLLGALRGLAGESTAEDLGAAARGMGQGWGAVGDHLAHGEDCRYCPVCQGIRLVRGTNPEVREHLAAAVGSLAQAVAAALRQESPTTREHAAGDPTRIDLD